MKINRLSLACAVALLLIVVVLAVVMGSMAYDLWMSGLPVLAVIPIGLAFVSGGLLLVLGRDLFDAREEDADAE